MIRATQWIKLGGVSAWGVAIWGALSLSQLPGQWGHGICGPWGCGPPLQALISCHLAWLVLLLPGTWLMRGHPRRTSLGIGLLASAFVGFILITVHEAMMWLPAASDWQRPYFLHRVSFVIATLIEFPVTEMLLAGCVLLARRQPNLCPQKEAG